MPIFERVRVQALLCRYLFGCGQHFVLPGLDPGVDVTCCPVPSVADDHRAAADDVELAPNPACGESGRELPRSSRRGNGLRAGARAFPRFELDRTVTPTPVNALGAKGVGEAGAIGSAPCIVNAVVASRRPHRLRRLRTLQERDLATMKSSVLLIQAGTRRRR